METLSTDVSIIEFDKIIEFEQQEISLFECFFFKKDVIVDSKFLTETELKEFKNKL